MKAIKSSHKFILNDITTVFKTKTFAVSWYKQETVRRFFVLNSMLLYVTAKKIINGQYKIYSVHCV